MGRTKGSKNKKKDISQFKQPVVKAQRLEEKPKTEKVDEKPEKILRVDGVIPRKEAPSIPAIMVDGGMLYRFLLELRRDYDNMIVAGKDDTKESRKRAIQVIDTIMDYIMRMEKKQ